MIAERPPAIRAQRSLALIRARHIQLLLGVTVAGAILRFFNLGARSYWVDEGLTLDVVRGSFGHMVELVGRSELAPPFYYVLAWLWQEAFGTSEMAFRSLSALAGTATVPVAYAIGAALASRRVGLVAALLAALSPLLIWHAQDARAYALLILLSGLSFLFFIRAAEDDPRSLLWWVVASALAITTHYYALFLVLPEALWLLRAARARRPSLIATGALVLVAGALAPLALYQQSGGRGSWISSQNLGTRLVELPAQYVVGYQPPLQLTTSVAAGLLTLVALVLLARRADARERRAARMAAVVGGTALLVPLLLVFAGVDSFTTRNSTVAWVPLLVLVAIGLGGRYAGRVGLLVLVLLCGLCAAVVVVTASQPKFEREDWRGASNGIGQPALRAIVLSPSLGRLPFEYYRPQAVEMPTSGALVREVVLVALPPTFRRIGQRPKPPRPSRVAPIGPAFHEVERREARYFTLVRFRSARPVHVGPRLAAHRLGQSDAVVLLEHLGRP